ncbi:flagellar basal body FlgE domain-containing protein [Paludibacterium denitrificans]|uniref:flagellar basal body FlgE domain-containing protein n=1 Tax=Paludibacterium denitrificans TaxID=2675226 RepID=UPI001E2CFDF0|nr:flagellar basal body FlgE domain-containing protein [Paludibacterium denitrificans]
MRRRHTIALGNSHDLTLYYVKGTATAAGTPWTVTAYVDGNATGNSTTLNFDTSGNLITTPAPTLSVSYTASYGQWLFLPDCLDG